MSEPEIGNICWSWISRDSDTCRAVITLRKNPSLADVIEHLRHAAPDVPLDQIAVSGSVVWEREANAEEMAERDRWRAAADERHAKWERETYALLKAKFEGTT